MKSNTRFNKNKRGIECLNCHQPLHPKDNFCSNCGQVNDTKPLSIKQYITELLGGFFAFDTRTLKTLKPLLLNPGKVTNEYVHGSRMKYVNPFQLYLHTSIIFFLITGVFMSIDNYDSLVAESIKKEKVTIGETAQSGALDALSDNKKDTDKKNQEPNKTNIVFTSSKKYNSFINSKTKDPGRALDSLGYKKTTKNFFMYKKLQEVKEVVHNKEIRRKYINKMISKSSIIMFFLLPLFTLFVSLLYIRRKKNYTENLIFVFNVQTVFFILLLVTILFNRILNTDIGIPIFLILFLIYLYKSMRNFYKQGRFKTFVKFLTLNLIYFLLSLFGVISVAFLAFLM